MMPNDGQLSSQAIVAAFVDPIRGPVEYLHDYEFGGINLNDGSQGLNVQLWELQIVNDKKEVQVSAPNVPWTTLFIRANPLEEASLAFDNNMNPFVVFVEEGGATFYYWFDTVDLTQKFSALPVGCITPRCCIDDKRMTQTSVSDIVLSYLRGGSLYVRYQRERYQTEHLLQAGLGDDARIIDLGMNRSLRLQFWLRSANPVAGSAVVTDPFVGDIVKDLCTRSGINTRNIDVTHLYEETVVGYPITTDEAAAEQIKPLADAFFFDPSEYDRKLHFVKRGGNAVMRITYKDLVDRDGGAFKQTIVQEDKLPIRVEVNHLDPDGGFNKNMQPAFRKSNLVKAKAVDSIELPFAATADQAATIALKNIKMKWHEPVTYEWWLTVAFTELVPTDIIEYADEEGNIYRIRIEERNEDSGYLKFKGKKDGGRAVYGTSALGLSLPPPISTAPGLVGETRLEILNIPVLRDQDDELGVYVGVAGSSSAWYGADVLISTDGGVNYYDAFTTEQPATLGDTETDLEAEISAEYGDEQSVIVQVNFGLDSVDYDALLNNYNRCVIGDELMQFQTATHLGNNRYLLSGLIRGRYNTKTDAWPAGTRFVLIDSTIFFLQAQQWMLGQEIYLKPVSYGLTEDESVPTSYDFDVAYSQLEWPPHYVQAERDGSDNVTVTWIPRPRLGIETAPYNSKYFTGYKIVFSDGFTATSNTPNYTRTSTPSGATVKVCGVNSITGDGEFSEEVNT